MNIKIICRINSNKNYYDQLKKNKHQKKMLKSNFFSPLWLFNINNYLLYLYIICLIGYSCRGQVGYTHTHPHPRIKKSPNPIIRIFNWVYNISSYPLQFGLSIKFFIVFREIVIPIFKFGKKFVNLKRFSLGMILRGIISKHSNSYFSIYRTVYMPSSVNRIFKI